MINYNNINMIKKYTITGIITLTLGAFLAFISSSIYSSLRWAVIFGTKNINEDMIVITIILYLAGFIMIFIGAPMIPISFLLSEKKQKCPYCHKKYEGTPKFCKNCGEPLEFKCPKCKNIIRDLPNFCDNCGKEIEYE